jgi:hypothetical protein
MALSRRSGWPATAAGPTGRSTLQRSQSATVFDARSGRLVASIALPGSPEFAVADPAAGRIYENIEDKNLIVAIDVRSVAIVNQWPIAAGEGPVGIDIDTAHHRLFVGGHNQRMLMLGTGNGHVPPPPVRRASGRRSCREVFGFWSVELCER